MSASSVDSAPNAKRLLIAGFMAILAAGVGFALRGGIFGAWASEYGFTATQLGAIGGAGFSGFCFGIIIGGVIVDKLGYGKLVALALLGHVLSAVVTFMATKANAYDYLYWGMFIFAYANGTLEAVANPLVATVFPHNRTHYLNILHASWPLGMVVGAVASYALGAHGLGLGWKGQLAFYLVPTALYAIMFLGQHFPKSEASKQGLSLGEMFPEHEPSKKVADPLYLGGPADTNLVFAMVAHHDGAGDEKGHEHQQHAAVVVQFAAGHHRAKVGAKLRNLQAAHILREVEGVGADIPHGPGRAASLGVGAPRRLLLIAAFQERAQPALGILDVHLAHLPERA